MQDTRIRFGRLVRAGLIAGALAGCGGSGASEAATPAGGEPSGDKHQCKAGHSCDGEMNMKHESDAGATPHEHVPE